LGSEAENNSLASELYLEVPKSSLNQDTSYPYLKFLWFYSVIPGNFLGEYLNLYHPLRLYACL